MRQLLGTICVLWAAITVAGPQVDGVRIGGDQVRTRLVLDLNGPVQPRVFTLRNPHRLVVDVPGGRLGNTLRQLPAGRGHITQVRGADRRDGLARVVVDLRGPVQPSGFMLPPTGSHGYRLVVDLTRGNSGPVMVAVAPVKTPQTQASQPKAAAASRGPAAPALKPRRELARAQPAPRVGDPVRRAPITRDPATARSGRLLVVAIDPGHGGKDPGAVGRSGIKEKDAVLQISQRLARLIDAEPGMRAVLTRKDDRFLPLRARMETARSEKADLFVSIHADAFRDRKVRGSSVYVLSGKGASDEASRRLAARENAAGTVGGVALAGKDEELASVLMDLSQNASLSSSMDVGSEVLAELRSVGHVRKTRVQRAPFAVLKSPDVPSILVETAFISNPQDERRLNSNSEQERIAQALHRGIRDYFYASPPPGTVIADLSAQGYRGSVEHLIRRGDTLSELASRYRVSVGRIRTANDLNGDRIRVGQILVIPPSVDI